MKNQTWLSLNVIVELGEGVGGNGTERQGVFTFITKLSWLVDFALNL